MRVGTRRGGTTLGPAEGSPSLPLPGDQLGIAVGVPGPHRASLLAVQDRLHGWAWKHVDRWGASRRVELVTLVLLTVAAAVLRLWQLENYPTGFHVDEGAIGLQALAVLQGRGAHPFDFVFIREPALFVYAEAACFWLFGIEIASIRALAGAVGALSVPVVWWLGRQLFGPRVGLLAAGLLAFSAVHIHFSRLALNIIEIPAFGLLGVACAWRGMATGRLRWHLLAGLSVGLGQYAAFGSRLFIVLLGGTYAIFLLANWRRWRGAVLGGVVALAGLALVVAPFVLHNSDHLGLFWDRVEARSVFRRWTQATEIHGTDSTAGVMLGQVKVNLLAFVNEADRSTFFGIEGEPLLFAPIGILFLGGVILALVRVREQKYAVLLLGCAGVLSGGVLSAGSPQFHRLLLLLPIAVLLAAVMTDQVARWLADRLAGGHRLAARLLPPVLLTGLVMLVAVDGVDGVFHRHPAANLWQPASTWARWLETLPAGSTVYLASMPDVYSEDERLRLLGHNLDLHTLANPTLTLPALRDQGTAATIALNPRLDEWLPLLAEDLPGAAGDRVVGRDGKTAIQTFTIDPSRLSARDGEGLNAEIGLDEETGDRTVERIDPAVVYAAASELMDGRPYHARWSGFLLTDQEGKYRLETYTDGGVVLMLDGQQIVAGAPAADPRTLGADLQLKPGRHELQLRYTYVRGPGRLELRWNRPGAQRTVIPPSALRPS